MPKTQIIELDYNKLDQRKLKKTASILLDGGLIAIPTDTVYGLAVNSRNQKAVRRLYDIKKRPSSKPFVIQIPSKDMLAEFNLEVNKDAELLISKFWPGPLTIILKSKNKEKLAFRIPKDEIALGILKESNLPLYVPSANFSGDPAPRSVDDVIVSFDGLIEAIIRTKESKTRGLESTIVDMTEQPYLVLREAAVLTRELNALFSSEDKFTKAKNILAVCTGNSCRSVMAKGFLKKAFSGRNDVIIESAGTAAIDGFSPTKETIEVMQKQQIDISDEKSKHVNTSMVKRADLIFVMQKKHKDYILELNPEAADKVYLLKEFKDSSGRTEFNIADPIGQSLEVYERVCDEIKIEIERIKDFI
jgi:tRNA threonylcarbamoyl adenosine modification protein (Sua5/YciO/YrdC/YwlC family)